MRHTTRVPRTLAIPIDAPHDFLTTYPTPPPLATPWWRPAALLHVLQTFVTSLTRRRPGESRWTRPDFPRWETPTEMFARKHPYLYIDSLSS